MFIPPREFERLVEDALASLPPQFAGLFEKIALALEQEQSDVDLALVEDVDAELLGIYRDVARTRHTHDMLPALPDQIAIFRGPINRVTPTPGQELRQIRATV